MIGISLITGMMLGIEFPDLEALEEDLKFAVVVDLFIIRIMFGLYKEE